MAVEYGVIRRKDRLRSWKMLLFGYYWICLCCHIIAGDSTLHDVISAAASVDHTTGGNNNNNKNGSVTNKKNHQMGSENSNNSDDDIPFHWSSSLLNQQRSFSSFSGQGVQIHTSKRKPDDPDVGVLVRILRSATPPERPGLAVNNNDNKVKVRPNLPASSTGGLRHVVAEKQRHRRNIIKGDKQRRRNIVGGGGGVAEEDVVLEGSPAVKEHRSFRKVRSVMAKKSDQTRLMVKDSKSSVLDQSSTLPLQYIIVVVSVPTCIVFLFVTLFSYSFFN